MDQAPQAVVGIGGAGDDALHLVPVGETNLSPRTEGQQLLHHVAGNLFAVPAHQGFQAVDIFELRPIGHCVAGVDLGTVLPNRPLLGLAGHDRVALAPASRRVVVLEGESRRVDLGVAR